MRYDAQDLSNAAHHLKNGGILLYPTDTVWGLGCDARNPEAVARLNALKARPAGKSLIILLQAEYEVSRYVEKIPEAAMQILEVQEEPITIIYPGAKGVAPGVAAEDGTLAIRLTDDPFCIELIKRSKCPLVSTSANFSGQPTASHFGELDPELMQQVDYVCEHRRTDKTKRKPSSIIKIGLDGRVQVIRS